jgi:hypothetical protein
MAGSFVLISVYLTMMAILIFLLNIRENSTMSHQVSMAAKKGFINSSITIIKKDGFAR